MASITFKNLESTNTSTSTTTYTDIHLDVVGYPIGAPRDILVDNDIDAIKNSLSNLFSTVPGQKLLNPTYGLNLLQFLFEPVTNSTANMIGEAIVNGITKFEPRVSVVKVKVVGDAENNEYDITLIIKIPALSQTDTITLNSLLSNNSTISFV